MAGKNSVGLGVQAQPEPFVDVDAVASFLSVERRQVLQMARRGIIPAHPLIGQGVKRTTGQPYYGQVSELLEWAGGQLGKLKDEAHIDYNKLGAHYRAAENTAVMSWLKHHPRPN